MIFEVKKGKSFRIVSTIYTDDGIVLADLDGCDAKALLKKDETDRDSQAVATFTLVSGMTVMPESKIETVVPASVTNDLSYPVLYFEILVKLADGNYIRSDTDEIQIKRNIINTLI
jgi:hypothetical protein